ncbi:MAG: hypothetical protein DCC55_07100 [Chloroflexi bacterium]|nr:MAG: hypothetical protein DCC55_07100 [Chloroflexota bacterium]
MRYPTLPNAKLTSERRKHNHPSDELAPAEEKAMPILSNLKDLELADDGSYWLEELATSRRMV